MSSATKDLARIAESIEALSTEFVSTVRSLRPPDIDSRRASFMTADNLFSRLLPKKYLEDFHTTTIAYFLDYAPNDSQPRILLRSFLELLTRNYPSLQAVTPQFAGGFEVHQEAYSDGFIDILLTNPKSNHAIIIENKIRAPDQGRQLPRYYWETANNRNYQVVATIYLSLDGHQPDTGDWTEHDLASVHPVCMSYGTLVDEWLEPAIESDELAPIHTVLKWYCQIIKHLREEPMMKHMFQEFSAQLAEDPKALRVLADIVAEREEIEQALCVSYYEKLSSRLSLLETLSPEPFALDGAHYIRFRCTDRIDYVLSFEEKQYSYGIEFNRQDSKAGERKTCKSILGEQAEVWTKDGFDTVFVYSTAIDLADDQLYQIFDSQHLDGEVKRIHIDIRNFVDAFGT